MNNVIQEELTGLHEEVSCEQMKQSSVHKKLTSLCKKISGLHKSPNKKLTGVHKNKLILIRINMMDKTLLVCTRKYLVCTRLHTQNKVVRTKNKLVRTRS